jgi:acetate kinase
MSSDAILTLNAGSSTMKFALFEAGGARRRTAGGAVEKIGGAPHLSVRDAAGKTVLEKNWPDGAELSHEDLLTPVLDWVAQNLGDARLVAAGHRIVHGGADFAAPVRLDAAVLGELAKLNPLAPLQEPHNLAAVAAIMAIRPKLTQIGCFDTGFHHKMPAVSTRLPLPRTLHEQGIRRYGFHGLSYESIAATFARLEPRRAAGRVVALHLGSGASACAMLAGKSIDSSMGFTALDGLIMGTRCGAIDPGVVLYLMQIRGMTAAEIYDLLYKKSGLLGLSALSSDMRVLLASRTEAASEAVESFILAAAKYTAALITSLGGLDALIFTAGIGEHAPEIRAGICARLQWLGLRIDAAANAADSLVISEQTSAVQVYVIPTDEEKMIAQHCRTLLA